MLTPIETVYRGCRFRSRLEARWAVFFQTLGVRWEYESQGFKLSNGEWYLPDFRVQLVDTLLWCEVKPTGQKTDLFSRFFNDLFPGDKCPDGSVCAIVLREIPDPNDIDEACFHLGWDEPYHFCICPKCSAVGFEYNGWSERIRCGCPDKEQHHSTADHPRILSAYAAARSARFEHGENGEDVSAAFREAEHLVELGDVAGFKKWFDRLNVQKRRAVYQLLRRRMSAVAK
jgi:hypothetical protein